MNYKSPPNLDLGLSETDIKNYSISRALLGMAGEERKGDEWDMSHKLQDRLGATYGHGGLLIPDAVLAKRDLSVSGGTTQTVGTKLMATDFIELLRNSTQVGALGATILGGLQANIAIPRQSGAGTAYWTSTDTTAQTESDQTFDQVSMSPLNLIGFTKFSRQLLLQSTPGIDELVREDLVRVTAIELDRAAINGSGSSGQPTGVLNTSGINSVALGTNGAAPTWTSIVQMIEKLGTANALRGKLGFLGNAQVLGTLRTTAKIGSTYPLFIMEDSDTLAGYPFKSSQNVPANLTKGTGTSLSALVFANWQDLLIARWGVLEVLVNPYAYASSQEIGVHVYDHPNVAVRHALSFCAISDMVTT